ncbi:MAG TPA: hypothetical protein DCM05_09095 [Elusimicrobia bacterium]|nr:MAG: hypothetical protein A2293_11390 [Elusimicrobia bacterium RIFOXYB2_FULL_49_7]HAH06665.1 hypothetical protein [Elusimicrobiota bacterium]
MAKHKMKPYFVISRELGCDGVFGERIEAENDEEAWEIVQESIATNMSQDWLFTADEFGKLKELCEKLLAESH